MIVVINPSGGSGHSFSGLHAYCAHDQDRADSSERVDWIEARNIAIDDPAQAWKVMIATAQSQNALKAANGVAVGRPSKLGPVQHVVLSFDKDEPQTPEAMREAADEFLASHGVDPKKMRARNKPKRRQFANEHQVMIYAHNDGTSGKHLHLMINRVHPETGLNLPSNNDQLKASKWALEYSKRHGTDHKTPARAENADFRAKGEFVKAARRKSRNVYEREQAAKAVNDNHIAKAVMEAQSKKDAALALRGRNMAKTHASARERVVKAHRQRKAALARTLQKQINAAKSSVREEFRPLWRALPARQKAERRTFEALEKSFFGRAGNVYKTLRLSAKDIHGNTSAVITRTFKIVTNAADRLDYFDKAQKREKTALQRRQTSKLSEAIKSLQTAHTRKLDENRSVFSKERKELAKSQAVDEVKLKADWKTRTAEREKAFGAIKAKATFSQTASPSPGRTASDKYKAALLERYARQADPKESARDSANEQDNSRDGGEHER
jgi:MobA/VirD2-like, nuclease domain